ncbi:serine acetyltransferase 1 [Pyrus ussuriensis x Pyrus communis]|uniref:Serine acetyltransferase 1 n=1 Tax=Pyrus ussuriensis x Pyrus communis TaxID=2448454 RepID=A0A5N5F2V9_9ROSA|nr:serine acetyltransferase 1 [Pyrus ussuriensis x Pyrus communis]
MAACIDTQTNQLSRDPNKSSSDKGRYQFMNFCRRSLSDQDLELDEDLWLIMQDKARSDIDDERILSNYYDSPIREVPTWFFPSICLKSI